MAAATKVSTAAHRTSSVTADDVLRCAGRIVERHGVDALTMRRLSDDLGVAVTSIYWHVGNRDAVLDGLVDRLLEDLETAPVDARLKPLLAFVRKLMLTPGAMTQADADAVFAAGWDEKALHDAIAVTARAAFMQRLVEGHGFTPMPQEVAAKHAKRRVELGYVNMYPAFRDAK